MILPLVAPALIRLPAIQGIPHLSLNFTATQTQPSDAGQILNSVAENRSIEWETWKIIALIYFAGSFIVFARLIYQAIFLQAVERLSGKTSYNGFTIISMNTEMVPFSYFNRIFIPESRIDEYAFDNIIEHEKSHLRQGHYFDLFLVEIITVLQWFNPFIWLLEKSIKETHEYLADEAVLNTGKDAGTYQALMVNQAMGGPVFILTNQFNQSLIKKRIMMMKNMKTSGTARFKALLILPVIAGLMMAFGNAPFKGYAAKGEITVNGNVTDRSTGKVLSGCVILIKGTTTGTVTDKQGNYQLVVSGSGDELVVTQVGYRTQTIAVGLNTRINVLMEPDYLAIDFGNGNKLAGRPQTAANDKTDKLESDKYVVTEELPTYPGGTQALYNFLMANLHYPESAKNQKIQGSVLMSFIIDLDGSVTSVKIIRGLTEDIDKEAVRLTSSIKGWTPARQNGNAVRMAVTMPIDFKLN
jgi:TonB family protein